MINLSKQQWKNKKNMVLVHSIIWQVVIQSRLKYLMGHLQIWAFCNIYYIQLRQYYITILRMLALKAQYSRIFISLRFSPLQYLFSGASKMHLSLNAQRSVLATAVIREITDSSPPMSFSDLSLREKILKLNPLTNNTEISPQVKNQIFQLFTTGLPWNISLYDQGRLHQASQYSIDKQRQQMKFIFCPNYLTTQQIFKMLVQQSNNPQRRTMNTILTGSYGMAKTMAYRMYIHISNYIHRFYHQAQQNQEVRTQYQHLINQNLISIVPKCFYCSLHDKIGYSMKNVIYQQTTELSLQKRKILLSKLKNPIEFKEYFGKLYPQHIHKKIIIDQAEYFTQQLWWYNNYYLSQRISKLEGINLTETYYKQMKQYRKKKVQKVIHFLYQNKLFGDKFIFTSSEDVSRKLQQPSKCGQFKLNWNFQHIQLQCHRSLFKQKWGVFDFWQYFWFQIERNLIAKHSQQQIEKMKKIFFEKCIELKIGAKPYFRFIFIRNFLKKYSYFDQKNTQKLSKNQFSQIMSRLIKLFIANCQQTVSLRVNQLCIQQRQQAYYQVLKLWIQQQKDKQVKDLDQHLKKWLEKKQKKSPSDFYDAFMDGKQTGLKNIFLTCSEMLELLAKSLYPRNTKQINFAKKQRIPHAHLLYYHILQCLNRNNKMKIDIKVYQEKKGKHYQLAKKKKTRLEFIIQRCKTCSISDFSPKNLKELQLSYLLNYCKANEGSYIAAIPQQLSKIFDRISYTYISYYQKIKFDLNAPIFDFMIARYNKSSNTYAIHTFNLTLKDEQEIKQKRKMAIICLEKLLQSNQQNQIEIIHTFVCSAQSIPTKISKQDHTINSGNRLKIQYSNWESIEFKEFYEFQKDKIQDFENIVKWIKQQNKAKKIIDNKTKK